MRYVTDVSRVQHAQARRSRQAVQAQQHKPTAGGTRRVAFWSRIFVAVHIRMCMRVGVCARACGICNPGIVMCERTHRCAHVCVHPRARRVCFVWLREIAVHVKLFARARVCARARVRVRVGVGVRVRVWCPLTCSPCVCVSAHRASCVFLTGSLR